MSLISENSVFRGNARNDGGRKNDDDESERGGSSVNMADKSSQFVSASADMAVDGVAATTYYDVWLEQWQFVALYSRLKYYIRTPKIANLDEEAYDLGYDYDGNLGPVYGAVEDEEYADVYEEEEALLGDPAA